MAIRKLRKEEWQTFFDRVSRRLPATQVEIEIDALDLGHQTQVEWVPLDGLTFDPNSNVLEVVTPSLDHMIQRPREIHVDEDAKGLRAIQVIDGNGAKQIIQLRAALQIPAAEA